MASKDEKNKIKIIQTVLDFHTKDLISTGTIQMDLKKNNTFSPAGASASDLFLSLVPASLLARRTDEHRPETRWSDEHEASRRRHTREVTARAADLRRREMSARSWTRCCRSGLPKIHRAFYYRAYFLRPCKILGPVRRYGLHTHGHGPAWVVHR